MEFLYLLEELRSPLLDGIMSAVTELGGESVFIVAAIVIFWCVDKSLGYYVMATGFTGTILNQFLKLAFHIPRPWVLDESFTIVESAREGATGFSFPSGHTQNALTVFGAPARWAKGRLLRALCVAAIALVAFSRMYLGVHTPKDVLVSLALGTALVFALYPLFRDIDKRPKRLLAVIVGMIAINLAYVLYTELWPFGAVIDAENLAAGQKAGYSLLGASIGLLPSYLLDIRRTHFKPGAPLPGQVLKVTLGLAIVLTLKTFLKAPLIAVLGNASIADALRYFIMIVFAAGIWPMTFTRFSKIGRKSNADGSHI